MSSRPTPSRGRSSPAGKVAYRMYLIASCRRTLCTSGAPGSPLCADWLVGLAGHKAAVSFLRTQEVPELWKMDMSQILDSSSSDEDEEAGGREKDSEEEEEGKKKRNIKEEVRRAWVDLAAGLSSLVLALEDMRLTATSLSLEGIALEDMKLNYASLSSEGLTLKGMKLIAASLY